MQTLINAARIYSGRGYALWHPRRGAGFCRTGAGRAWLAGLVLMCLGAGELGLRADADLAVLFSWAGGAVPPPVWREMTFVVTVTNRGPDVARGVWLTNDLPATFLLHAAIPSVGSCSNQGALVFWDMGDLTNQQAATLALEVTPTQTGLYTNQWVVGSTVADPDPSNNRIVRTDYVRPPYCYLSGATVVEGDEGFTNAFFTVWLEMATPLTVSMSFGTDNMDARAGVDYIATNGTLVFPPGVTHQTVDVTILGDRLYETGRKTAAETFYFRLSNLTNGWFFQQQSWQIGTILDDDPMPWLSLSDASVIEGESSFTVAEFTVSLSELSGATTTFQYATSNGTAEGSVDYNISLASGSIPAGQSNGTVRVTVFGDSVFECDEFFFVSLLSANNALLARTQAVGTILSDELLLRMPASVQENDGILAGAGEVILGCGGESGLTVVLSNAAPGLISVPALVVIPPGASNVLFDIQVLDDLLLNGSRGAVLTAVVPGRAAASAELAVHDNETTRLSLEVPSVVEEYSGSHTGWVHAAAAPDVDVVVELSCDDTNTVQTPEAVILPGGQTSVPFLMNVPTDLQLDGSTLVRLTARVPNWGEGVAMVTVTDLTNLSLTLPAELTEGQWATGTVRTTATAMTNLPVALASSEPGVLSLPETVDIPAGEFRVYFAFQATENGDYLGTRATAVTVSSDVLRGATSPVTVLENDPHHFTIDAVPVSQEAYAYYYNLLLVACDHLGEPLRGFNRSAALRAQGDAGSVDIHPSTTLAFAEGTCSNQYYYFQSWDNNVRIMLDDGQGHIGLSNPFNIVRPFHHVLDLPANDLVWDAVRGRIIASVRDYGNLGSNTLVFIDPIRGKVEGTLEVGPSPGRMAISDDSRYLYVSFLATNIVRRLDLAAREVDLEFSLGEWVLLPGIVYPRYVDDMQVQPGNPEVVAIARMRPTVSPRAAGIAIFDHGVERLLTYGEPPAGGPNYIGFGGWPARLYAYDTQVSSFTFHRLNVTDLGVAGESATSLMQGYGLDFVYGNGRVYVSNGQVYDPETGGLLGRFPNGVAPIPAPDIGRVICIRQERGDMLQIYRESTLELLHQRYIPGCSYSAASPLRWGESGVAFRAGDQVYILYSDYLADLNANGLPDSWEREHFGAVGTPEGAPEADPDQDGLANRDEQVAGTDPWDAASTLRLSVSQVAQGAIQIEFLSLVGRCYALEKTTGLGSEEWSLVRAVPGTGDTLVMLDPEAFETPSRFYRVRVFF